jgi:hypothetical protein
MRVFVLSAVVLGAVIWCGATSPAAAEARDAADRSLRSDHNALENDLRRDTLKPSGRPSFFPWQWNGDASSPTSPKSKKKAGERR